MVSPRHQSLEESLAMRDEITLRREANAAATALLLIKTQRASSPRAISSLEGGLRFCDFLLSGMKNHKARATAKLSFEDLETMRFATRFNAVAADVVAQSSEVRMMLDSTLKRLKRQEPIRPKEANALYRYFDRVSELMVLETRYSDISQEDRSSKHRQA